MEGIVDELLSMQPTSTADSERVRNLLIGINTHLNAPKPVPLSPDLTRAPIYPIVAPNAGLQFLNCLSQWFIPDRNYLHAKFICLLPLLDIKPEHVSRFSALFKTLDIGERMLSKVVRDSKAVVGTPELDVGLTDEIRAKVPHLV